MTANRITGHAGLRGRAQILADDSGQPWFVVRQESSRSYATNSYGDWSLGADVVKLSPALSNVRARA